MNKATLQKLPETESFASRILAWYQRHGRKDLPWQQGITAYRVWVSEIMLQQTQVATVIPYFEKFIARFPGLEQLASASEDEVLHYWSGLGYYSRARNLHKSAKIICEEYDAQLPGELDALQALPGVGRSTAGAIRASAFEIPTPILDGNVKRVLARHEGIAGWPGQAAVAKKLWEVSAYYTPDHEPRAYTQAIMDLGATLCTRSKPDCQRCPLRDSCIALADNRISELPGKKPKKALPVKQTRMHILINAQGHVLLEKRPPAGVWASLWSFPEQSPVPENNTGDANSWDSWPILRHTFSHFHLDIQPVVKRGEPDSQVMDSAQQLWYNLNQPPELGLAAPVSQLLRQVRTFISD